MKVQDVMTQSAKSCGPENNLAEAVKIMWEGDYGSVPIIGADGKLLGMITDRDVAMAAGTQNRLPSEILVAEVMSETIHSCTPDQDIQSALKTMRSERIRRLPVVNRNGEITGIISMNDITLRAERPDGPRSSGIAHDDVITTLKAICEHRNAKAAAESQSASS